MLAIVVWIAVLCISSWLFYKVSGSLSLFKPNMNSIVFYYSLLVSCFIGSLLIVLGIDQYYMIQKLNHESSRLMGFISISVVMILLPLTMLMISKIAGFNAKTEFSTYLEKPVEPTYGKRKDFYVLFLTISVISIMAVAYTLLKTNQLPIIELLKGSTDLGKLRIDAARNFSGNVYIRNIFAIALTPLLSLMAYVYAVKTKQLKWRILFLVLFASAVLISIYDLSKAPIFFYAIMFILVRIYIGSLKLNRRRLYLYIATGTIVIVFMYVFIQGVDDLKQFLSYSSGPIGRIILAQISPFFLHLDIFGESLPLLTGSSLPSLIINWFDMEQVRSARLVMANAFPNRIADGTGGVLNTIFIAEAYANFGYLGIFLSTIYVGALIQVLYIVFIRLPKNPIFVCLFIYFSINIPRTLVGGFADFILNPIWIFITCLFVGLLFIIKFRIDLLPMVLKKKTGNEL